MMGKLWKLPNMTLIGKKKCIVSLRAGFEPARGDPIGFQVQRLNHSAIAAERKRLWSNFLSICLHSSITHLRATFPFSD